MRTIFVHVRNWMLRPVANCPGGSPYRTTPFITHTEVRNQLSADFFAASDAHAMSKRTRIACTISRPSIITP